MSYVYNPLKIIGLDRTSEPVVEDGSISNPLTDLNVKRVPINIYHKIKENRQNIVTETQFVDGVLIIDGVNTIL
jgi:hypothetical protein